MRDGFHALVVLPSGELIAALPGVIATLRPGKGNFKSPMFCGVGLGR